MNNMYGQTSAGSGDGLPPSNKQDSSDAVAASGRRLSEVILLAGSVHHTGLREATGRVTVDLPIDDERSLLSLWVEQVAALARAYDIQSMPLRVMVDQAAEPPRRVSTPDEVQLTIEKDLQDYRGTAGVLHDICAQRDKDAWIVVANAAQLLLEPIVDLVHVLMQSPGDVVISSSDDGMPTGVLLLRAEALRPIASAGFVDMKEQGLPVIAQQFDVRAVHQPHSPGLSIRTLRDYITALKHYHDPRDPDANDPPWYAEDWQSRFAVVESGAQVADDVVLHNAVVLRGGRVEKSASLFETLVCSGGVLGQNQRAYQRLISTNKPTPASPSQTPSAEPRQENTVATDTISSA